MQGFGGVQVQTPNGESSDGPRFSHDLMPSLLSPCYPITLTVTLLTHRDRDMQECLFLCVFVLTVIDLKFLTYLFTVHAVHGRVLPSEAREEAKKAKFLFSTHVS